jgi:hypothetical protein
VLGILLKLFCAMRTSAKVQRSPRVIHRDGRFVLLFCQTNRTHSEIAYFLEVLLRIGNEHGNASFTAEAMLFAVVVVGDGHILTDSQPDKGAAARGTDWRLHLLQPLPYYAI